MKFDLIIDGGYSLDQFKAIKEVLHCKGEYNRSPKRPKYFDIDETPERIIDLVNQVLKPLKYEMTFIPKD